jgi:hypothetical protein
MVQRIVKLIGAAYSTGGNVQVQATYNGAEIINAPVNTTVTDVIPAVDPGVPSPDQTQTELVIFETTTDVTGQIPVTISVTGGTLFFRHFWMNYTGFINERQATDPNVPINPDDPSTYTWVTTVEPDSYYSDPNTNTVESDGISNLTKNGRPWTWRVNVGDRTGDWVYPIANGETVTFDFFVDPAKVVLVVPT